MFFAEMGAEVIKVENTETGGDTTRAWKLPSEPADRDISSYFACTNWGKQSIGINLQTQAGREIVWELAKQSDIVIVSYKSGDSAKFGVDYDTLSGLHPGLIYGEISAYGELDTRPGFDALIQAESGFMSINGEPTSPPTKMPVALIDILAAHQLKEGLLVALIDRMKTGKGSRVSVSLFDSAIASLANQGTAYLAAGECPTRLGSEHPSIFPYGAIFRCLDEREIVIAVGTDHQFAVLCGTIGVAHLGLDRRFSKNQDRVKNREALRPLLREAIVKHSSTEIVSALTRNNVPAGHIRSVAEALETPEAVRLRLHTTGTTATRSTVFTVSDEEYIHPSPPPHFGEHSEKILTERLKYSKNTIASLRSGGVVR